MDNLIFICKDRGGVDVSREVVGNAIKDTCDVVDPESVDATASKL